MVHYIYWLEPRRPYQRRDPSQLQCEPLALDSPNWVDKRTVVERADAFPTSACRVRSPPPPTEQPWTKLFDIGKVTSHLRQYWRNPAELFLSWFNDSVFNFASRRAHQQPLSAAHHGLFWEHFSHPGKVSDPFEFPFLPSSVRRRRHAPVVIPNVTSPIRSCIETDVGLQVLLYDPFEPVAYI
jgi:hypothetical protein